jgi:hypothetical protein
LNAYRLLLGASLVAAALALFAGSVKAVINVATVIWAGDYLSYAAAGGRILAGTGIYAPMQLAGPYFLGDAAWGRGYVYPPPSALFAVPFAMVGEPAGFSVFTTVAGMAFGLAMFRVARNEGLKPLAASLFTLVVFLSPPSIESLGTGQANTLVAVGLLAIWLYPNTSGYIAVVGGVVKLFPLAGLAWAVRCRAPLVRPLILLVVLLGLSLLVQGPDTWHQFVVATQNGQSSQFSFPTPPRHILEPLIGPSLAMLVSLVGSGVLLLLTIRVRSAYLAIALLSLAMILPAPDWYVHYLLIPLAGVAPWFAQQAARLLYGPASTSGSPAPA